jgi:hypothetical protein
MTVFEPAVREQMRLRMALSGVSGSGKTNTAMILAQALSPDGRFAVIDTEKRANEYADRFEFGRMAPSQADPELLPGLIAAAADEGYGSLIIDSFTHFWSGAGGALDKVDRVADKRAGWNQYRPIENAMMEAILGFPGHVIVTLRVKTEYAQVEAANGRQRVQRIGMKPDQREGVDYEFSVIGDMDVSHTLTITKTTCAALVDKSIEKPGIELAATLREWLGQGTPAPTVLDFKRQVLDPETSFDQIREIRADARRRNLLGAFIVDERGLTSTLEAFIVRIGHDRKPNQLAAPVGATA